MKLISILSVLNLVKPHISLDEAKKPSLVLALPKELSVFPEPEKINL
jgi:hypothetical protein